MKVKPGGTRFARLAFWQSKMMVELPLVVVSMLVEDTMPPMLETLRSVDPTFRERPHLNSQATTAYVNAKNFSVEFLTPNRGSDDNAGEPTKMPALGGA